MARRTPAAILLAWLVTIAVDFLIFGGLFVGFLEELDHPAVLDPEQLFVRIPAGYASFLLEVLILDRVLGDRRGVLDGLRTGALTGLVFASAVALGLWSFSTVPVSVLVLWWLTLLLQLTAAGAVLGGADTSAWPRVRRWAAVGSVALVAVGLVLQNLG